MAGEIIPEKSLDKVFAKDFIAENPKLRPSVSPGLGFYFCKLAVEAQGGKIGIGSNSKETRFYFLLPA